MKVRAFLCGLALAIALCAGLRPAQAQNFNYQNDIGFTRLKNEQGAGLPSGTGLKATQVEAPLDPGPNTQYFPDTTFSEFAGKTITARSPSPATSSHATTVGRFYYGNPYSLTPNLNTVDVYEVNNWLTSGFLQTGSAAKPNVQDTTTYNRVANHSWVGDFGSSNADALHRVDYLVENDDYIQVVGVNNPGGAVQPLLSASYNAIAVGLTSGGAASGTTAIDSFYVAGRAKPDIVAPQDATSWATPNVASAANLLVQNGHNNAALSKSSYTSPRTGFTIRNAETSEAIKAILMAGADRAVTNPSGFGNITDYRSSGHTTTNGLDTRYGAGQLDIYNSYHIQAAGEQDPGAISTYGFDYNPSITSTGTAAYTFSGKTSAIASLVWNAKINGGTGIFNGTPSLADFNLDLYQISGGMTLIASSHSTIDNTENIYTTALDPSSTYEFLVSRADSLGTWDYALAWQVVPEPSAAILVAFCGVIVALGRRRRRAAAA